MDALKNLLLAGLGAVSASQEKLKEVVDGLIEKGQLSKDQGEKVINEWIDRGRDQQDKVGDRLHDDFQKLLTKLPVVSREEFDALQERVAALEARHSDGS